MKVIIDDVEYEPIRKVESDSALLTALELRLDSDAGNNITIRQYLFELLNTLWGEGESFSGKRPFGNSGWEYELFTPLVKSGFISGSYDDEYGIDDIDKKEANAFVGKLIAAALFGIVDAKAD